MSPNIQSNGFSDNEAIIQQAIWEKKKIREPSEEGGRGAEPRYIEAKQLLPKMETAASPAL